MYRFLGRDVNVWSPPHTKYTHWIIHCLTAMPRTNTHTPKCRAHWIQFGCATWRQSFCSDTKKSRPAWVRTRAVVVNQCFAFDGCVEMLSLMWVGPLVIYGSVLRLQSIDYDERLSIGSQCRYRMPRNESIKTNSKSYKRCRIMTSLHHSSSKSNQDHIVLNSASKNDAASGQQFRFAQQGAFHLRAMPANGHRRSAQCSLVWRGLLLVEMFSRVFRAHVWRVRHVPKRLHRWPNANLPCGSFDFRILRGQLYGHVSSTEWSVLILLRAVLEKWTKCANSWQKEILFVAMHQGGWSHHRQDI